MIMNHNNSQFARQEQSFIKSCARSCQKMLSRLQNVRDSVADEFRNLVGHRDRMLDLALHEAESLAYQTGYPQLVFPVLAREKAEAVVTWTRRQRELRHSRFELAAA